MGPVVAPRRHLLRVRGARREDRHRPRALLVRRPVQRPRVILQCFLVGEIGGPVVVRKIPVNVDIFKHCLFTGECVKQL